MEQYTRHTLSLEGEEVCVYLDINSTNFYITSPSGRAMHKIANELRQLWNAYAGLSFGEFVVKTLSHE